MRTLPRIALSILSGLSAAAAFPPVGWWPLALVAWGLMFAALRGAGFKAGFHLGLLQGVVFYGVAVSWLWNLFQHASIGLWFILALFGAAAGCLIGGVSKRTPALKWLPLLAAALWAALEFYRAEWFALRFPWMTSGLALGPTWLSPVIGVYGAGFLLLLAGALLALGGREHKRIGAVLTAVLAALGLFRPGSVRETTPGIPVLAAQSENCDLITYVEMTAAEDFQGGIILWPEYAAPFDIRAQPRDLATLRELAAAKNSTLILGTFRPAEDGDGKYNEALVMDATGIIGSHDKSRPVHFMDDGLPGTTAKPVKTRHGPLGTPICFDSDYTEIIRHMTAAGAQAFTVPSMDAVSWSERQHLQHAEIFRHRALENGRWFAVCATSGRTQIIDPHGNRVSGIPLMKDGVLHGQIHLRERLTFYTRIGWIFPWLVCAAAIIGLVAAILTKRHPHKAPSGQRQGGNVASQQS